MMILGVGVREQIIADAHLLLGLKEAFVIMFKHRPRRDATLVCFHRNRRAVTVAPAHHQNMIASKAMITREYVSRQIRPSEVSDVHVPVGIGPRHRNVDKLIHSGFVLPLCYILPLHRGYCLKSKNRLQRQTVKEFAS